MDSTGNLGAVLPGWMHLHRTLASHHTAHRSKSCASYPWGTGDPHGPSLVARSSLFDRGMEFVVAV